MAQMYIIGSELMDNFRKFLEAEEIKKMVFVRAKHQIPGWKKFTTVDRIKRLVAREYAIPRAKLDSKDNHPEFVLPRHLAFYLTRKHAQFSYPQIGMIFGGRHHTSVIYGIERIEQMLLTDEDVQREVKSIEKELA